MKLKTILLADDNQNDIDLTILALSESNLANNIEVVMMEWRCLNI